MAATATNDFQKSLTTLLHDPHRADETLRKILRQAMFMWMVTSYAMRGYKGAKRMTLITPVRWFVLARIIMRALAKARA